MKKYSIAPIPYCNNLKPTMLRKRVRVFLHSNQQILSRYSVEPEQEIRYIFNYVLIILSRMWRSVVTISANFSVHQRINIIVLNAGLIDTTHKQSYDKKKYQMYPRIWCTVIIRSLRHFDHNTLISIRYKYSPWVYAYTAPVKYYFNMRIPKINMFSSRSLNNQRYTITMKLIILWIKCSYISTNMIFLYQGKSKEIFRNG